MKREIPIDEAPEDIRQAIAAVRKVLHDAGFGGHVFVVSKDGCAEEFIMPKWMKPLLGERTIRFTSEVLNDREAMDDFLTVMLGVRDRIAIALQRWMLVTDAAVTALAEVGYAIVHNADDRLPRKDSATTREPQPTQR